MTTPLKPRNCSCPYRASFSAVYKPDWTPLKVMEIIRPARYELEVLDLCDGELMTQEEAGVCERGTAQRRLAGIRCKVAPAIVRHKAQAISGSNTEYKPDHSMELRDE